MKEETKQIAERLKGLRELSGKTVETFAKELEVSKELYLEYESGTMDIPMGLLHKAAGNHGLTLSSILTGEEPRLNVYCVVRKDKGLSVERRKQYKYENLAYNFIHKKAEPFMVRIEPDQDDAPMEFSSHPGQEFDYVIEGKMKIVIDNHEIILDEGDSIYYDSGHKHAMKALNNKPVKMLAIIL